MKFFHRTKRESLSELQGVPHGTFRCDVCKFVQPAICICGAVADARDNPPRVYTICGVCAIWLGFGEFRFPQGLRFNLSEEEREKIKALHREIDSTSGFDGIGEKIMALANESIEKLRSTDNPDKATSESLEKIHEFLEQVPNWNELVRLRASLLPDNIIDLSGRLTRGEFVDPSEIEKANK